MPAQRGDMSSAVANLRSRHHGDDLVPERSFENEARIQANQRAVDQLALTLCS